MRYLAFLSLVTTLCAQPPAASQTNVYTYDPNGNRVLANQQSTAKGSAQQSVRNMNGRVAPLEQVEERVISEDSTGRVVEKLVRTYDGNGAALPPQRIRITERKEADGVKSIETQVYQGNINGGFSLTERTQALQRTAEGRVTIETQVARPTINGSLDTVEKKSSTITTAGEKVNSDTLVYRRDNNGSFYTAAREVKETDKKGGVTTENIANYISGERRELQLAAQTVSETTVRPDGSETRQVNVYGTGLAGRPDTGQPTLREQQIIEKNKTANGTVETLSVRRPAVDDPKNLGPAQKISEKVCTGPCT